MRINIFFKTFFILLLSFSLVFLGNLYFSYQRFSPLYIDENINAVKSSILSIAPEIEQGALLSETDLMNLSSETSFIRFNGNGLAEMIGPSFLSENDVLDFVIEIYDNDQSIIDGKLTYYVELIEDIYHINYIYQFDLDDYLIISTQIQSLQNVDRVLTQINITQSIFLLSAILLLSIFISYNIAKPIKKINLYAKDISNLNFTQKLKLKRRDEFKDLVTSLNEMTFNLKESYRALNEANQKLSTDMDFEKAQEEKKKHLIMTINHELKTPLAVMRGMIEGMIDGVGRYKDKETYLKALLDQIESIEHMIKDLTYALRLEDKMKKDEPSHTKIMLECINDLETLGEQLGVQIHHKLEASKLQMSDELLKILATNVMKNAILYTEDQKIHVYGTVDQNTYTLIVKNKGHIPEASLDLIFDSFYRIHQDEEHKGSGLGLFIVKQICDLYHYSYKVFNDASDVVVKIQISINK